MAIKLVLGLQVSDEQVAVEKEIPSLLNQFSQNFRSIVTSCLQKDPKYVCMNVDYISGQYLHKYSLCTATNSCSVIELLTYQKDEEGDRLEGSQASLQPLQAFQEISNQKEK